jgi:Potential Monad-binding region of RPAP3
LDAETVSKAVEITQEKVSQKLLKSIPKTAAGFESDFNSLKKDLPTFYGYVKNIPVETVSQLFKTTEISAELFAAILKVVNDFGIADNEG